MEDRYRAFEPVQIGMISVESSNDRFDRDGEKQAPAIAYWRVNLTALSQSHNLYFIATRDTVQVYQPGFPYQTLGHKPALTIVPQLKNPAAEGYIDARHPHNINHLIVGNLGTQEILLLSTDSGNVVGYNTSSIINEIEKINTAGGDGLANSFGVRPFFAQWVYESAWGLAIHSEGRMIAVSANTPHHVDNEDLCSKITVFAFALTLPERTSSRFAGKTSRYSEFSNENPEWNAWSEPKTGLGSDVPERDRNYKIVLGGIGGHQNNIPCVAFVNGPEDTTGSWLLSTDITGDMKLWQIWKGRCFKTWDFNSPISPAPLWFRARESGWLVAALDIYSFKPAESMDKFLGRRRVPPYSAYPSVGNDSYDLTGTVHNNTPQSSENHPTVETSDGNTSEEELDELDEDLNDSEDEAKTLRPVRVVSESSVGSFEERPTPVEVSQAENSPSEGYNGEFRDSTSDYDSDSFEGMTDETEEVGVAIGVLDMEGENADRSHDEDDLSSSSRVTAASSLSDDAEDSNGNETSQSSNPSFENSMPSPTPRMALNAKRHLQSSTEHKGLDEEVRLPRVPVLHCSTAHLRMFHGPAALHPHIFCARLLRQHLPPVLENTNLVHMDRLSLLHQIPELGIVLIATQLGRCAICSLTKRTEDGLLGFRVDWIVPTKKQERNKDRPAHCVLLGIAASPIQGRSKSNVEAVSGYDTDENWAEDRIIGGIPTSFDPEVVILRNELNRPSQVDGITREDTLTSRPYREKRSWPRPSQRETWTPYESSRRYRLMLTYSDMTVLTYELSRGVEREDIAVGLELDSLD